jgi:hypothetical protein
LRSTLSDSFHILSGIEPEWHEFHGASDDAYHRKVSRCMHSMPYQLMSGRAIE